MFIVSSGHLPVLMLLIVFSVGSECVVGVAACGGERPQRPTGHCRLHTGACLPLFLSVSVSVCLCFCLSLSLSLIVIVRFDCSVA